MLSLPPWWRATAQSAMHSACYQQAVGEAHAGRSRAPPSCCAHGNARAAGLPPRGGTGNATGRKREHCRRCTPTGDGNGALSRLKEKVVPIASVDTDLRRLPSSANALRAIAASDTAARPDKKVRRSMDSLVMARIALPRQVLRQFRRLARSNKTHPYELSPRGASTDFDYRFDALRASLEH